jgi:acyl-CoA reductase-like NAD-dependent aldehyde dehydrogenase
MSESDLHRPFIGGRAVEGETRIEIRAPWDGRVAGTVALAGPDQIQAAIASVAAAAPGLADTPAHRRAEWLEAIAGGIRRDRDALVRVLVAEAGKPVKLAQIEVDRAIDTFTFGAVEARRAGGEVIPLDAVAAGEGRIGMTRRFPVGPVAGISPFNFPLNLVAHKLAPALAAGCPLVLKPADQTPLTALRLARIAAEAGVPAGAFDVVPCDVADVGPLIEDERLRALSFTGSAKVGWSLKGRAGRKRVLLELGGNAAAIVHADADLDLAANRCAFGAFAYAGQSCISVQRVLVHERVHDAFVERLLAQTEEVKVGDPADPDVVVGPVRSDADADRLMGWIDEAQARGARALCGGTRQGRLIAPTVLVDVDPDLPIACDEAFGPVLVVDPYRDLEDAFRRVNRSRYGLQAGIFSRDIGVVMRAFAALEVGGVIHDDAPTFRVDHMPYGGVKASGLGREGVRWAMDEMTEVRILALRP